MLDLYNNQNSCHLENKYINVVGVLKMVKQFTKIAERALILDAPLTSLSQCVLNGFKEHRVVFKTIVFIPVEVLLLLSSHVGMSKLPFLKGFLTFFLQTELPSENCGSLKTLN